MEVLVQSSTASAIQVISLDDLSDAINPEGKQVDIVAIYGTIKDKVRENRGINSVEKFVLQAAAVKKYLRSKVGGAGRVKLMGFDLHMGGQIGEYELNMTRLTAIMAVQNLNSAGIETAMYKRLGDGLKNQLETIKSIIASGLHFLYRAAVTHEEDDFFAVLRGIENIRGKIFVGCMAMDWMALNFQASGTAISFKSFSNSVAPDQRGAVTSLLSNMRVNDYAGLGFGPGDLKVVKVCTAISEMPAPKGGANTRYRAILDKMKSEMKTL